MTVTRTTTTVTTTATTEVVETKQCSKCKQFKDLTSFNKDKSRKSGLQRNCKPCDAARARAWQAANPERYKATKKAYDKARYEVDPDKFKANSRAWQIANPEQFKATTMHNNHKARAIKFGVEDTLSQDPQWWPKLLAKYNSRCVACGTSEDLTVEHVIPMSRGGAHSWDNVSLLCLGHNKGNKDALDYRLAHDFFKNLIQQVAA